MQSGRLKQQLDSQRNRWCQAIKNKVKLDIPLLNHPDNVREQQELFKHLDKNLEIAIFFLHNKVVDEDRRGRLKRDNAILIVDGLYATMYSYFEMFLNQLKTESMFSEKNNIFYSADNDVLINITDIYLIITAAFVSSVLAFKLTFDQGVYIIDFVKFYNRHELDAPKIDCFSMKKIECVYLDIIGFRAPSHDTIIQNLSNIVTKELDFSNHDHIIQKHKQRKNKLNRNTVFYFDDIDTIDLVHENANKNEGRARSFSI